MMKLEPLVRRWWPLVILLLSAWPLASAGAEPSRWRNEAAEVKARLDQDGRARVMVLLNSSVEPAGSGQTGRAERRAALQAGVAQVQEKALAKLDPAEVKPFLRLANVPAVGLEITTKGWRQLNQMEGVKSIQAERRLALQTAQGLPLIQPGPYRDAFGGAGLSLAVIDTGLDYRHPALGGGSFPNARVIGGYDFGENDPDPLDNNGHGTACAGVAAGSNTAVGDYIGGVAPQAGLYALKVAAADGSIYDSAMLAALDWCLTHQDDKTDQPLLIVSISLGDPEFFSGQDCDDLDQTLAALVKALAQAGVALFVASGNYGLCQAVTWPACLGGVISVGAVYDADLGSQPGQGYAFCVNSASCVAKTQPHCPYGGMCQDLATAADLVPCYSDSGPNLKLLAPNGCAFTPTLGGGYVGCFTGTSAATPYAAGAAAVIQGWTKTKYGRFLSPIELRDFMTKAGDSVLDPKSGLVTPRVNIQATTAAVDEALRSSPSPGPGVSPSGD